MSSSSLVNTDSRFILGDEGAVSVLISSSVACEDEPSSRSLSNKSFTGIFAFASASISLPMPPSSLISTTKNTCNSLWSVKPRIISVVYAVAAVAISAEGELKAVQTIGCQNMVVN
ncbi:hypothetical protein G6F68_017154 [Rhizopus microsporus]|nr:hypothetical protein G6F68_017154 [Rhizopus microsporus]